MMKRRQFFLSLAGAATVGWAGWRWLPRSGWGARTRGAAARVTRSGWALGAPVKLTVFHPDAGQAESALEAAFAELEQVEHVMSLYRPDSQVCRLNASGHLADPHPWLVEVLRAAADLSRRTGGVFDITVQPLMRLYLDAAAAGRLPTDAEIAAARAKVDWRRVELADGQVRLRGNGTAITLNGIAQGFAADAVGRVLAAHGIASALIDTGEIGTLGAPARRDDWSIGIQHPRQPGDFLGVARLNGRCLATSGDYETRFAEDFTQHHLLDPRTGRSPGELASVSIAAPTALQADALSTAAFVLGLDHGRALVEGTPGAAALFVTKGGHTVRTADFPLA